MTHDTCIIRTASVPRWSSRFSLPHDHAAFQELRSNTQAPPDHDRWAADDQRPPRAINSDHCQLGRPLYIALLPVAFRPRPALDDPLLSFVASTCATVARRVLSIVGARRAHSLGSVAVIDPLIERRRQRRLSEVLPTQPAVALGQQRPDPSSDCCFTSPISRNRHQADRWNFGTRTPAAEPSSPPHCQLEYRRVRCDKAVWPGNPRRCAATHPTLTMCLGSPRMKASTLSTSWFARH